MRTSAPERKTLYGEIIVESLAMRWFCPECRRVFNRANVKHSCGTGDRAALLRGKPAALVKLYERLEEVARSYGAVEIVAKDRYALLRTTRIFADVVFMKDALRLALVLDRAFDEPLFFKTVRGERGRVQQVAKLHDAGELARIRACTAHSRGTAFRPLTPFDRMPHREVGQWIA